MKPFHQRIILAFRVTDDDVVTGNEKRVGDLAFCAEGLAAARCTEDKAVRVFVKKNFFITGNISRFDML